MKADLSRLGKKCEARLKQFPSCDDTSGKRSWVACNTRKLVLEAFKKEGRVPEHITEIMTHPAYRDAVRSSWASVKQRCS